MTFSRIQAGPLKPEGDAVDDDCEEMERERWLLTVQGDGGGR